MRYANPADIPNAKFERLVVGKVQAHATEADGRYFKSAFPSWRVFIELSFHQNARFSISVTCAPRQVLFVSDLFHPIDALAVVLPRSRRASLRLEMRRLQSI